MSDATCIARQQWRARIETCCGKRAVISIGASPASNGGRGLKPGKNNLIRFAGGIARQQWRARIETSASTMASVIAISGIARQQWRARIETRKMNNGDFASVGIARQQWRARIETKLQSKS